MITTKHVFGYCVTHDANALLPVKDAYDVNAGTITIPFKAIMEVTQIAIRSQQLRIEAVLHMVQGLKNHERVCSTDLNGMVFAAQNLSSALQLRNQLLLLQERDRFQLVHIPVTPLTENGNSPSTATLHHI